MNQFEPTYEELKLGVSLYRESYRAWFEPTYEELK
ncbi:MAG: hypothetical protein MW689_000715 [Thermodesulfobacteria bacterium]|nr:hypothetical protein [Thermodesulfobacteriota bacterium]